MGKAVKFSLTINNVQIRTLEELKDNFEIAEVVELYRNQKLQNWLLNRGYNQELQRLSALQNPDLRTLVLALLDIFNIDLGNVDLDHVIDHVAYKENLQNSRNSNLDQQQAIFVVHTYYQQYLSLLEEIQQHSLSLHALKNDIKKLLDNYYDFLSIDFIVFINLIARNAPLAMLVLMCHQKWWDLCDLFDNHDSRWCQNLSMLKQQPDQPAKNFHLEGEAPVPAEVDKGWFAGFRSKFNKIMPENTPAQDSKVSEMELGKKMVINLIVSCQQSWANYIRAKSMQPSPNWERVVEQDKICLVLKFDETVDLRAAGARSKLDGVSVCVPFALSNGLECKCNYATTIYYVEV